MRRLCLCCLFFSRRDVVVVARSHSLNHVIENYSKVVQRDLTVVGGDLLATIMRTQADPKLLAEPQPVILTDNTMRADLASLLKSQVRRARTG